MRCGRCGNDNAQGNRFCGMCGAALVAKTPAGSAIPASVSAGEHKAESRPGAGPASAHPPARSVSEVPPAVNRPTITGPSFLGLNQPMEEPSATPPNAQRHRDHLQHSSKNLDYLLEDEEDRGGWVKVLAVVIALGLALGFGYLHWKQGGFDWLLKAERKPAAATQPADTQPSNPDSGAAGASATPPPASSTPATPDATGGAAASPPAAAGTSTTGTDSSGQQAPATQTTPVPLQSNPPPDTSAATKPADSNTPADTSTAPAATEPTAPPTAPATPSKKIRAPKPSPVTPVDPVAEAERYLYGRGARQDCDRGLRLVKAAAGQSNAKAMISLGALYSTGTCTPRDLPTAYRWFALALHKEPDNQALQDDLQKLWSQMTQPERQLAIRLSQ